MIFCLSRYVLLCVYDIIKQLCSYKGVEIIEFQ